tara:strand:+ start:102 stop:1082 length:981 start_codon:yes stop_codon:yes gene_type:complete
VRIVFWGTPNYAANNLLSLINSGQEIIAVVTQPDRKRGRGNKVSPSPVKVAAENFNIPIYTTHSISKDTNIRNLILELEADIYIVVAFGQILPQEVLEHPKYGCWNSHASLLPKWRGAAPIQWSIINGDLSTGVCIMAMEEGLDTGAVINKESINISNTDNFEILSEKLCALSSKLIIQSLDDIKNTEGLNRQDQLRKLKAIKQSNLHSSPSYARQLKKEDYLIDWNQDAKNIFNKIRGLYPNSYTLYNGKRIKLLEVSISKKLADKNNLEPGTVIEITQKLGIIVKTKDKAILINSGQLEGKKKTNAYILSQQTNLSINDKFNNS